MRTKVKLMLQLFTNHIRLIQLSDQCGLEIMRTYSRGRKNNMLKKNSKVNRLQDSEAVVEHLRFVRQCQTKSQVPALQIATSVSKSHSVAHFFSQRYFFQFIQIFSVLQLIVWPLTLFQAQKEENRDVEVKLKVKHPEFSGKYLSRHI